MAGGVDDSDPLILLRETLTLCGISEDVDPRRSLTPMMHRPTLVLDEHASVPGHDQPTATLESLPLLTLREGDSPDPVSPHQFHVLRTIGQGGMGRVELARQPGLDREVAVKRLRAGRDPARASRVLIREARLMGGLEHPNIPPIYALGRSDDEPVLAMKRIRGTTWAELIGDPEHPAWAERPGDHLERNLEVLMQVCQAVHFAHSRQILHLDIKLDNVMLGRFGEVYLIDWGGARRFEEVAELAEGDGDDPVVGTPAYMAPEMTMGLRGTSPATDVYLLGATLHEIITGQPRHRGRTVLATLRCAMKSEPHAYSSQVHPELASIANRACHADPAQRFGSAQQLRQALAGYLRLRSSLALSDAALERLAVLERLVAEHTPGERPSQALRNAFSECRFGFEQALGKAAHNERAQQGRHRAYALMIDTELGARNAGAAEALLEALAEPDPPRHERLERLRESLRHDAEAQARLQAIKRELAPRNESWARTVLTVVGSLVWLVFLGGMGLSTRMGWLEITPVHNLVLGLVMLGAASASTAMQPQQFLHNRVIRQMSTLVVMAGTIMVAARVVALSLELPLWHTAIEDMLVVAMFMGCAEVIFGKLLHGLLITLVLVVAVFVASLTPPHAYEIAGVLIGLLNFKLAWDMRPQLEAAAAEGSAP